MYIPNNFAPSSVIVLLEQKTDEFLGQRSQIPVLAFLKYEKSKS